MYFHACIFLITNFQVMTDSALLTGFTRSVQHQSKGENGIQKCPSGDWQEEKEVWTYPFSHLSIHRGVEFSLISCDGMVTLVTITKREKIRCVWCSLWLPWLYNVVIDFTLYNPSRHMWYETAKISRSETEKLSHSRLYPQWHQSDHRPL